MMFGGSYKLADFGTATVLEAPLRRDECGTLWIMAPELLGRRPHGLNCDVWPGPRALRSFHDMRITAVTYEIHDIYIYI